MSTKSWREKEKAESVLLPMTYRVLIFRGGFLLFVLAQEDI